MSSRFASPFMAKSPLHDNHEKKDGRTGKTQSEQNDANKAEKEKPRTNLMRIQGHDEDPCHPGPPQK